MNHITDIGARNKPDDKVYLANEDNPSPEGLDETLSLADTLEEDRTRYEEVIRDLIEFEEEHVEGEARAITTAEGVNDFGAGHGTLVS